MRIAERRRRADCAACAVEAVDALALRRGASDRAACTTGSLCWTHERPDVDSKLGDKRHRLVRRERRPRRQRHARPLVARFTTDCRDNTVGVCDRFDIQFDDGALGSFHGSRRVTQFVQWAAPCPGRVTQAERHELRLAVSSAAGSEPAIEGGSVRALFEQCLLPLASNVDAAFVALLAAHVPFVHDAALALRLSRRPLRQAAAPLQRAGTARRACSAARSATRSCRARAPRSATCLTRGCGTARATFSPTASCLPTGEAVGGSAPTFADSLAVWYRVSPGETALRRSRKCSSTAARSSIRRAARCSTTTRSRSRGRMALAARADFVLVRPSELMSRAWMKDAADALRARLPEHQAHHQPVQPHQPLGGVGNSAHH